MSEMILQLSAGQGPAECEWAVAELVRVFAREAAADALAASARAKGLVIDGIASAVPGLTPLQQADVRIAMLQGQLAEARKPKSFNLGERLQSWADDVGLGLGWAIVYFALVPVWWKGQTVGKRVMKLRVIYDLLETITDRCEDVANVVEGIVLENS